MTSGHGDRNGTPGRQAGAADVVRRVFDELPVMVLSVEGPDLVVSAANAAFRAYVGRSEIVGMPLREAFPELVGQQVMKLYEDAYAAGEPMDIREWRIWMDHPATGRQVELFTDFTMTPRHDAAGEVTGLIVVAQDATDRVRERRAVQQRAMAAEQRYERARDVIDTLQRELLPSGVPVLPGVQVAASYLLADAETAAGGDWFDAIVLDDGRLALIVGDVVGHGVVASATMGQLRVVVAEHLATGDVLAALRAADAATARIHGARAATVCVAVLDPGTGVLTYATAGHPPPLVIANGGETRYLPTTPGGPLAAGNGRARDMAGTAELAAGDLVLLYTDGILERPGRELSAATVELAQVAADSVADRALFSGSTLAVERVCEQAIELLTRVTGHNDDITLLAVQLTPAPPGLSLTVTAVPGSLAGIRAAVDTWLGAIHAGRDDADGLRHVVVELATNAMDHAYLDSADEHTVTILGHLTVDGHAEIRVADQGVWREPRPSPDRGLGLQFAAKLIDFLRVEHDARGTTATVRHSLTRPAHLLTTDKVPSIATRPAQADPLLVLEQPSPSGARIRVDGPVDGATAGTVEREIGFAGSTGARSLLVDLTGVSHLASAGVAVLHRLAAQHRDNGTELRLYAPAGSNADMIMTLVDLPHHTTDPDVLLPDTPSDGEH